MDDKPNIFLCIVFLLAFVWVIFVFMVVTWINDFGLASLSVLEILFL